MKRLKDAFQSGDFVITAELAPNPRQKATEVVEQARLLAGAADAIQVSDHRNFRPHISAVSVGAHLIAAGINPVVRMNCRDRNRLAIQSELLAAQSFGISDLLLSRGSDIPEDHRPPTSGVYDISAIDLMRTAAAIRDGEALVGGKLDDAPDFFLGAVATAFKPKPEWTPEKLLAKADAGAQFIQLQMCLNTDVLSAYATHLVAEKLTWRFQLIANIAVLTSVEEARKLRKTQPDALIPSALVSRLEQATDAEAEGIVIAAETLTVLNEIPGISGANIQAGERPELVVAAVEQSGLRQQ